MSTLYSSIEAAEVRCSKPEHCKNCHVRHDEFMCKTFSIGSHIADNEVREMYWECLKCGHDNNNILYVNKHSEYPLLTVEQTNFIVNKRQVKTLTLKDIAQKTGISVSQLSDFERRHNAPTPTELSLIMDVLGIRAL